VPDYRAKHGPKGLAEGAYLFKVDLDHLQALQYSSLSENVEYESGLFLDQWTLNYFNESTQEAAVVKVRFSPSNFG
jgi:hypothetical protein